MGFLNEIKKVIFGVQSVGKSAANKAVEAGKELGQTLQEQGGELLDQAKAKTGDLVDRASEFLDNAMGKVETAGTILANKANENLSSTQTPTASEEEKPVATNPEDQLNDLLNSTPQNTTTPMETKRPLDFSAIDQPEGSTSGSQDPSLLNKIGSTVINTTLEAGKKVEDLAANAGDKLLDAGEVVMDKFKDVAGKVGGTVLDKGASLWEKAKDLGNQAMSKTEELMKKADEEAAKEGPSKMEELIQKAKEMGDRVEASAQDKNRQFTDSLQDAKKSGLETHDDFFAKAQKFADGDHSAFSTDPIISKDPDFQSSKGTKTHGFEDNDGDGNDLIDDAIIEK